MIFSYYIFKYPYTLFWHILKKLNRLDGTVFYCADPLDHYVFEPVNRYLNNVMYVTDKPEIKEWLHNLGLPFRSLPVFPTAVIMARHSTYKFPCHAVTKIGMRHGAYHFKRMTSAANYNQFDLYLMTSRADVYAGEQIGITCAKAIGFPKLDAVINGVYDKYYQINLKTRLDLDLNMNTILFTATYNASGMSAIDLWYRHLSQLRDKYNILVTLHPWIDKKYRNALNDIEGVYLIHDINVLPYIVISDVVIGDSSSILAECCALNKPMITFEPAKAKRSLDEIDSLLEQISYRVSEFHQIESYIKQSLANPEEHKQQRAEANKLMFDVLDGKAGQRAAQEIKQLLIASE